MSDNNAMLRDCAVLPARQPRLYYNPLLACLLAVVGLIATALSSALAASPDDAWLYLGFDGAAEQSSPSYGFEVTRKGQEIPLLSGRVGNAIRLDSQQTISIYVSPAAAPFPVSQGSVVLWMRPDKPLDQTSRWLMTGGWANFELYVERDRLLAYATSNSQYFLAGNLSGFRETWANNWHMIVMTWADASRQLFVDGQLLASSDNVASIVSGPTSLQLGYLPGWQTSPDQAYFEGAFDEFAILRVALTPSDVSRLYQLGTSEIPVSVLEGLGGAVVVWTDRHGWLRGETAKLSLAAYASGDRLRLEAVPADDDSVAPLLLWDGRVAITTLNLDTRDLRPGKYRLRAAVLAADGSVAVPATDSTTIRIVAQRSPDFPVGLDGLVGYSESVLEQASSWGLSFVSSGSCPVEYFKPALDRLLFHGLGFFPNMNVHDQHVMALDRSTYFDDSGKGNQRLIDDVLQILVLQGDDSFARFSSSLGSPFSPVARDAMRTYVRRCLEAAAGHPGLLAVSFDDEYDFRIGTDTASGRRYFGDYSSAARDFFYSVTSLAPVFPPQVSSGTVLPDAHPYFRWRDVVGMPGDPTTTGLEMSWVDLSAVVHETRPDVKTTTWSGGEYGLLDAVMDYAYPAIWQPSPGYPNGHGRLDFLFDRHRARQRATQEKPVWGLLGWWSDDLRNQPDWVVQDLRLNTVLALAKGAKLINWFSSGATPNDPSLLGSGLLSRNDTLDEMVRWAGELRARGSMYARLSSRRDGRVAVLLSDEDRVGKLQTQNQPLQFNWFYPAIRLAGFPVDLVTDDMVKSGGLNGYDALVLGDFEYASESLWSAIQAYARTPGKSVFVDTETALRPTGAVALPFHAQEDGDTSGQQEMPPLGSMVWMARILRTTLAQQLGNPSFMVEGSDYVAPFFLYGGEGRLLTLVNYHLKEAQVVQVSMPSDGLSFVYDADSGAIVARAKLAGQIMKWEANVPNAGSARYIILRQPIARVQASVIEDAGDFVVSAAVLGGNGVALRFPLPLRITLVDPQGQAVPAYTRYTAVDPDTGTLELRFPKSRLMDVGGSWQVSVREQVTGLENQSGSAVQ